MSIKALVRFGWLLICLLSLFCLGVEASLANQPFATDIRAEYLVDEQAQSRIHLQVTLTNLESSSYATEYALEVNSTNIKDVSVLAVDDKALEFRTTQTGSSTIIVIEFIDKIVGKDQKITFDVRYLQPEVAQLLGKVLEINIPKINIANELTTYQTNLVVHQSFKQPSEIRPKPNNRHLANNFYHYIYTEPQVQAQGISALFGDTQVMRFTLNYHLTNPTVNKGVTQITIPPDTPYQKLYYDRIEPAPESIKVDGDGNWLATYTLEPKQNIDVVAQGMVEIFALPTVPVPNYTRNINHYTEDQTHWPINHPRVKSLSDQLKTPRQIYDYIVDTFEYDYTKLDGSLGRLGGGVALEKSDSVICQEFTDAFITLARAVGIPAREHNGYAYTQNPGLRPLSLVRDVLHAWPEYFDIESQTWVPVDPTWGNTTGGVNYFDQLDLNHFTFVIRGLDSEKPYPAGYYKYEASQNKDILVEFANEKPRPVVQLNYRLEPNFLAFSGLPSPLQLGLTNSGNVADYQIELKLDSSRWRIYQPQVDIDTVLPYATTTQQLYVQAPRPLYRPAETISIESKYHTYDQTIQISPEKQIIFIFTFLALGGAGVFGAFVTWRLLVSRRKR